MTGILVATIDWTRYLSPGSLATSEFSNGITCILANACGQAYTYELRGGEIVFVGEGDRHDPTYDFLEVSIDIEDLVSSSEGQLKFSYENLTINGDFCPYSLHVFPSYSVAQQYYTRQPSMYTFLVVVVFIFTSLVFVSYDFVVER